MRYPIIRQHEATDCGPAVLAMIAAHHRHRISIARLRELAGTDRRATTLAGLSAAGEEGSCVRTGDVLIQSDTKDTLLRRSAIITRMDLAELRRVDATGLYRELETVNLTRPG